MLESQGDPIQISRLTTLPPKYVKEKIDFFLDGDSTIINDFPDIIANNLV